MAALADSDVAQVAAQYSLPPAVLMGLVAQEGGNPGMGLPAATLSAYNLSAAELNTDPLLALSIAARTLAQSFATTGSWESALSLSLTGDAQAWQSATSSVGGQVLGILGQAAINPSFGMSGYTPIDAGAFTRTSAAFATHLEGLVGMGGIVSPQAVSGYRQSVQQVTSVASGPWTTPQVGTRGSWNSTVVAGLQAAGRNNDQSYSPGQCTYYAARSLGYIPGGLGNAADWAHNAAERGMSVNDKAAVGTAVVYGANAGGAGADGHVAVVQAVNPDGTFVVSEMNVDGQWVADQRTSTMDGVIGFIHPPSGTNMPQAVPGLFHTVQTTAKPDDGSTARPTTHASPGEARTEDSAPAGQPQAPGQQQQKPEHPDPAAVGEFAAQLQQHGIDPQAFAEHFGTLAERRRQLLQAQRTDVSDYAALQQALGLAAPGQPVTAAAITAHVRDQPHPTYPNITVGNFYDTHNRAALYSMQHTQSMPSDAETARLVGLDHKAIESYYATKAGTQPAATHGALA